MTAAREMEGSDVFVVGGGNSAGQAAIHLARFARRVTILVRRPDLAATMSSYLIGEIALQPADHGRRAAREVVDGGGETAGSSGSTVRDTATGERGAPRLPAGSSCCSARRPTATGCPTRSPATRAASC